MPTQPLSHRAVAQRASIRCKPGVVLPTVMLSLVVGGVVALAMLRTTITASRSGRAFRESGLALYAAEAGLRKVTGSWPTASVNALNPGDSLDQGWQSLPNRASYRAVITEVDNGGLQSYIVIVQGRGKATNLLGGQRTIVRMVGGVPIFTFGLFSKSTLNISGLTSTTIGVDSYNSAAGAYNAATADSLGEVGAIGAITTTGKILGDVVGGSTVSLSTGSATGTVTANSTSLPTYADTACPTGGYTPVSSMPAGLGSSYSYNATTGVLTVSGGHNITLPTIAGGYYFSSVTLSGSSTMTMGTAGSHTDLYVDATLNLSGGGIINTGSRPTELSIWGCGSSTTNWTVSGGSGAYFSVYAPNHPVTLSGGGNIYGAVLGNGITNSGGSKVHFDEALLNQRGRSLAVLRGSWTELTLY